MRSKYGNWMRLFKIKNKLKDGCFFQIKSGRILEALWAFLIKTIIPLELVGYEMIIANSALRISLATTISYPTPTRERSRQVLHWSLADSTYHDLDYSGYNKKPNIAIVVYYALIWRKCMEGQHSIAWNTVWHCSWKSCIACATYRKENYLLADNYVLESVGCADFQN